VQVVRVFMLTQLGKLDYDLTTTTTFLLSIVYAVPTLQGITNK